MQVKRIAECCKGGHSEILSTLIKLPFVIKIFVLPIFEWPFNTGLNYSKFSFLSDKQLEMQFYGDVGVVKCDFGLMSCYKIKCIRIIITSIQD